MLPCYYAHVFLPEIHSLFHVVKRLVKCIFYYLHIGKDAEIMQVCIGLKIIGSPCEQLVE